jgi:hypothetical protein
VPRKRQTGSAAKRPVGEKQRAEDEKLRDMLRDADLKKFDKTLAKAVKPSRA